VPADSLVPLAREVRSLRLGAGEALFEQGDPGLAMFLVQSGSVSVRVGGDEVARLGAGQVIGEMAVIDGLPRSATCVAAEPSEIVEIDAGSFERLVRSHGRAALAVVRTLSERLRSRNVAVSSGPRSRLASPRQAGGPAGGRPRAAEREDIAGLVERYAFLGEVEIFAGLPREDLVKVAELATTVGFCSGEVLFAEGSEGDAMSIIRHGRVGVRVSGREVARIGPGDPIGEMALVDGLPRSATCVAVEDALLLRIGATDFGLLLGLEPDIAIGLMRSLSRRLRETY
jgi:CRP/FNR family cyclic AMP-dependent transcriptional regulator